MTANPLENAGVPQRLNLGIQRSRNRSIKQANFAALFHEERSQQTEHANERNTESFLACQ